MSRLSRARSEIVAVLQGANSPLKPSDVARLLGKNRVTVRGVMWQMAIDGQLASRYAGEYTLPGQDTTVPAVPASGIPSLWDDLPAFESCY